MWVPSKTQMLQLGASLHAHQIKVIAAVDPDTAHALGLSHLGASRVQSKFDRRTADELEEGLRLKGRDGDEGLETVRQERCINMRMPDVADYYYKARSHLVSLCILTTPHDV
jgi:hypothetical protein